MSTIFLPGNIAAHLLALELRHVDNCSEMKV
jgi:hypothetical protein